MTRTLSCDATGATLTIDGASRDAIDLVARATAGESRAPSLNLRNRALFETASAALTLTTAADRSARAAAIQTLQRRTADLPLAFFQTAAAAETDPDLRRQIEAIGQRAALSSPDPGLRIAALAQPARERSRARGRRGADARQGLRRRSRLQSRGRCRFDAYPSRHRDRDRSRHALQRPQPRQHPVHGGHRPRGDLRPDGRHQPGPGRDDHDRRLRDMARPAGAPARGAAMARLLSHPGDPRRVPGHGRNRHRARGGASAPSLQAAAHEPARDMGGQPVPDQPRAGDVRHAEPGFRDALLRDRGHRRDR